MMHSFHFHFILFQIVSIHCLVIYQRINHLVNFTFDSGFPGSEEDAKKVDSKLLFDYVAFFTRIFPSKEKQHQFEYDIKSDESTLNLKVEKLSKSSIPFYFDPKCSISFILIYLHYKRFQVEIPFEITIY